MTRIRRTPICEICRAQEATWALQDLGNPEPDFTLLGWHYRGFHVTKVCSDCKQRIQTQSRPASFLEQK